MIRYNLYPTLMDGFAYVMSCEPDTREAAEAAFIDRINRVPEPLSEAAARGTLFNDMVDMIIDGKTAVSKPDRSVVLVDGKYRGMIGDFVFEFDKEFAEYAAKPFDDCLAQVFTQATIDTLHGEVRLYGYVDEINLMSVYDIKTTAKYKPFKYEDNWQHIVYPYCLIESGQMSDIDAFHYVVYELDTPKGKPITGTRYTETYRQTQFDREMLLRTWLDDHLLPWLDDHRAKITDQKIFANPEKI